MTDKELIEHHGGPAAFARLLGMDQVGATQTVWNWTVRGIPADVKLKHPDVFGIKFKKQTPTPTQAQG